jgi:gluconokinase
MGVSGCGKTTVASGVAKRLGWDFVEADTLHSPANVAKMGAGIALTDDDRWPWLDAIAARIEAARKTQKPCVVACSALKRRYRQRLSGDHADVRFAYLEGSFDTIAARLARRTGHYMPLSLLESQFAALEAPRADEDPIVLSAEQPAEALVEELVATFS